MALVPFRTRGAAASQDLEERLLLVGPHRLLLRQRPRASGNTAHLQQATTTTCSTADSSSGSHHRKRDDDPQSQQQQQQQKQQPDLSNVGLVLWQSGFLLADFLLLRHQSQHGGAATWAGTRVLELGCGGGTVGMFLARAGAHVVLTDQCHILELTRENVALNFGGSARSTTALRTTPAQPGVGATAAAASSTDDSGALPLPPPCAVAAFAAAFGGSSSRGGNDGEAAARAAAVAASAGPVAAAAGAAAHLAQAVFAAGPLVAEFTWGEPLAALQDRVTAAAAQRLAAGSSHALPCADPVAVSAALTCFDVICGADLLYDPFSHQPLLESLALLTARSPAAQVWLAWRYRALGEDAFEQAATAAGWHVEAVSAALLHPEFREDATYRLVCMVRLPP